ncbi:MAG: single-stranded-DNA-specific exonuclease RecJ [Clostridiales bacterium]|nr:single-stranded-DNA-specific exonuclease RecJ [Clostridiales bacterium]
MIHKKWIIADADKEKASEISEKFNIDPFVAFLLVSRGISDELAVSDFLSSSVKLSDPFALADMDKAVERIEQAVDFSEKITIYGDYDCDGVTSTALLYSFLKNMGADVDYYIPSRESEGYGLNNSAVKALAENGTKLIVTVDNGVSAFEEAEYIYSLGMQLIITDHHQMSDKLPKAEAVVNPHREDNDACFKDLAGVGVALKLACAVYGDTDYVLEQYSDFAAIGTIADMVPLIGENRCLAKAGINMINSGEKPGIKALKAVCGYGEKNISSSEISFSLCPRINATGRIKNAAESVEILLCGNYEDAVLKAEKLDLNNSNRREIENEILEDVKIKISENPLIALNRVIVVSGNNYNQGVVGIVASHILEIFGKPVIIIGVDDNGNARGSARSVDGFNIYNAVSACSDLLIHFGGHPKAAGLSLDAGNIDLFRQKINEYAVNQYPVMPVQCIKLDFKLSPFYLDLELAENLEILEPYGECNKKAVFALVGLNILNIIPMGEGKHIRIECEKKGKKLRIVKFRTSADEFPFVRGDKIDAAVKISINPYNGKNYLSVQAVDIRKNGIDDDKYFSEKSDYELFSLNMNNSESVFPNREICSLVYKTIRKNSQRKMTREDLYFFLSGITYGQMMFSLDAFEECGLISEENGIIKLVDVKNKVDLMNSNVMKY